MFAGGVWHRQVGQVFPHVSQRAGRPLVSCVSALIMDEATGCCCKQVTGCRQIWACIGAGYCITTGHYNKSNTNYTTNNKMNNKNNNINNNNKGEIYQCFYFKDINTCIIWRRTQRPISAQWIPPSLISPPCNHDFIKPLPIAEAVFHWYIAN